MDVIVLGNGPFAVPMLHQIARSKHNVKLVVTRPDRPQGKHQLVVPGPVRQRAMDLSLPVEQPEDANALSAVQMLRETGADVLVVADFGQILSKEALSTARLGGINVHGSLLPKYRGAAPIAWAIYHGESETGVTIIRMTPQLDAGGMFLQRSIPIEPNETAGDLEMRLSALGADMAVESLDRLEAGQTDSIDQDASKVSRAPRLKKEDGRVDWKRSAQQIHDQVRAMHPWPIAYTEWVREQGAPLRLQILKTTVDDSVASDAKAGTVVDAGPAGIVVACGEGCLTIHRLKPAGKRDMDAATFLNGHPRLVQAQLD